MQKIRKEISKEEYERLNNLPPKEFYEEIEPNIPIEWSMGYGYYGSSLSEDKVFNKYYLVHTIGETCD